MSEKTLITNPEVPSKEEFKIDLSRVISHTIGNAAAEIVPALDAILRLPGIPLAEYEFAFRAYMVARDMSAKTSALAELFGEPDSLSLARMISYELKQFFDEFTLHLNLTLADKIRGSIHFSIDPESEADVIFDSRRVATILYHLIANALQHGRTENKNIKLICKAEPERFELIVRDYGGGVPKEIQPVLFTKFLEEFNIKQELLGLLPPRIQGLGLPLCRKLAHDMGGEITFRNYRAGAQFTLTIPQDAKRMQEPSVYHHDESLMQSCLSSLWLYLEEKKAEKK